nr:hypothetical protein [uncultured Cellulosilyticum sp.]
MLENKLRQSCKARFMPAKKAIEELLVNSHKDVLLVAIDGKCASGKTTLAYYLKASYDCNLFHMDDFFLQDAQRTPQRLAEIGGNIDYERFALEVIEPVKKRQDVIYRPFSCMERKMKESIKITPKRLNIIEGSYSMHPYFKDPYDIHIFMDIAAAQQIENIRKRNGEEKLVRFKNEWIPKENAYFEKFGIGKESMHINWCDIKNK